MMAALSRSTCITMAILPLARPPSSPSLLSPSGHHRPASPHGGTTFPSPEVLRLLCPPSTRTQHHHRHAKNTANSSFLHVNKCHFSIPSWQPNGRSLSARDILSHLHAALVYAKRWARAHAGRLGSGTTPVSPEVGTAWPRHVDPTEREYRSTAGREAPRHLSTPRPPRPD